MTEATYPKTVNGILIEQRGGGVYVLNHAEIVPPITVRGEEKANTLAETLGNQIASGLPLQIIEGDDDGEPGEDPAPTLTPSQELAELEARVAAMRAAGVTVAIPNATAAVDRQHEITAAIPSKLNKTFTAEQRKSLADKGIKTTRIILDQNDNIPPGGLFMGHNGRTFMLQPSVEADVPNFLLDVLKQAVQSKPVQDPDTHQVIGYRNQLRFPYQIVDRIADDDDAED